MKHYLPLRILVVDMVDLMNAKCSAKRISGALSEALTNKARTAVLSIQL